MKGMIYIPGRGIYIKKYSPPRGAKKGKKGKGGRKKGKRGATAPRTPRKWLCPSGLVVYQLYGPLKSWGKKWVLVEREGGGND